MQTLLFLDVMDVLLCGSCRPDGSCGHLGHLRRIADALGCRLTAGSRYVSLVYRETCASLSQTVNVFPRASARMRFHVPERRRRE